MITQTLQNYDEPKPVVVPRKEPPPAYIYLNTGGIKFTQKEINDEWNRARAKDIKVNDVFIWPNSACKVTILGFNFDPDKMESEHFKPCVVRAKRDLPHNAPLTFNYTVDEILEMERVND